MTNFACDPTASVALLAPAIMLDIISLRRSLGIWVVQVVCNPMTSHRGNCLVYDSTIVDVLGIFTARQSTVNFVRRHSLVRTRISLAPSVFSHHNIGLQAVKRYQQQAGFQISKTLCKTTVTFILLIYHKFGANKRLK